jgi:hypothetical protein
MVQIIATHDVNDITKGEEDVKIPIISDSGNGILPPYFHYIPSNITFQNAHVNLSLARIGDESCCSGCFGDCLAKPLPCACAAETGGEFAYTRDGLLREAFLDSCISKLQEPKPHKKFIKECWIKCGCARNCGNRVVQRGISTHLQVRHIYPFKLLVLPFCTKDEAVINECQLANMIELTIPVQLSSYICIY